MKFRLILAITILTFITSCNKYPGGPSLSLRSAKSRIINTWVFEQVLFNGADKTGLYTNYTLDYSSTNTFTRTSPSGSVTGTWSLNAEKTEVTVIFSAGMQSKYTILKLKENEFWYKETLPSGEAEYHLVPAN